MPKKATKRAIWVLLATVVAGLVFWLAWPAPVLVDMAVVSRGPMEVTIDDEAKTRVRHIYTVSAPVGGKVLRISGPSDGQSRSIHVGDTVQAAETVVATMQPNIPSFLDVRSREELQAMLTAAEAAVTLAEAEVRRMEAALEFSRSELRRSEALALTNAIPERGLEKARLDVRTSEAALASAKAQIDVRRSERTGIAVRLKSPSTVLQEMHPDCCIQLRAPVNGVVLKVVQDSEAVVQAGTPLVELGDPRDLEIVVDLLSTDAVQVRPDAPVRIDGWGGPAIYGRVVRVDPAGFLKVSALGIEEQRVRTTIDLEGDSENWSRLGHDYRVIVHVTIWRGEDIVMVPVSALFRKGEDWAVFTVRDGRARTTLVRIGQRNTRSAQVLSGVSVGDTVVLHPSDKIRDGVSVSQRDVR